MPRTLAFWGPTERGMGMGMAEVLSPQPAPARQWWMELAPCHTEESQSPGLRRVTETTELHTTFTLSPET